MAETSRQAYANSRTRVLPETELLDDLDVQEDISQARTFAYKVRKAADELAKMGPVLSAYGERIRDLAKEAREAAVYLEGQAYYDVTLHAERVLARSEQEAVKSLGEEASLSSRWEPELQIDEEIQRLPWTQER